MNKSIKYLIVALTQVIVLNLFAFDADKLISEANSAYNQGLYDSALATYQMVIDEGYESGELYYNIGNAYYKNNDIANAILYYEKAKKILPNDENIEYNLSIANSMIVDKIEKVPELFYEKWWSFFYNILDADTGAVLLLVIFALFVFSLGFFIIAKTRKKRKLSFYITLIFFLLTLLSGALTIQKYNSALEHKEAIVYDPSVTVKSSPTQNAVDLFVIHEGTKVQVIDRIESWTEIKIRNGSVGWLPSSTLKEI
jgi:tetratricopeptide (TPR) repeat protein